MKYFTLWSTLKRFSYLRKKTAACSISSCPEEALEMARQALASRRLSFEEDESCSVISMAGFPFKDCLVLAVETENPKMDFLHSMEQMTKAYGGRGEMVDWGFMEELLTWFLKINDMKNQHFIVAAFLDLCLGGVQAEEPLAIEVPVENVEPLANEVHDEIVNNIVEEILEESDGFDAECGGASNSMSKKGKHFKQEYSCIIM